MPTQADNLAAALFGELSRESVLDADRVLDDVRRIVWLATFSGAAGELLAARLEVSAQVRDLASWLDGVAVETANDAISHARAALWEAVRRTPEMFQ
jgi:hypothetical protein